MLSKFIKTKTTFYLLSKKDQMIIEKFYREPSQLWLENNIFHINYLINKILGNNNDHKGIKILPKSPLKQIMLRFECTSHQAREIMRDYMLVVFDRRRLYDHPGINTLGVLYDKWNFHGIKMPKIIFSISDASSYHAYRVTGTLKTIGHPHISPLGSCCMTEFEYTMRVYVIQKDFDLFFIEITRFLSNYTPSGSYQQYKHSVQAMSVINNIIGKKQKNIDSTRHYEMGLVKSSKDLLAWYRTWNGLTYNNSSRIDYAKTTLNNYDWKDFKRMKSLTKTIQFLNQIKHYDIRNNLNLLLNKDNLIIGIALFYLNSKDITWLSNYPYSINRILDNPSSEKSQEMKQKMIDLEEHIFNSMEKILPMEKVREELNSYQLRVKRNTEVTISIAKSEEGRITNEIRNITSSFR